jgi:hypothetical protein
VKSIDRMYLNVWQPRLAYGGGVQGFFVGHRGYGRRVAGLRRTPRHPHVGLLLSTAAARPDETLLRASTGSPRNAQSRRPRATPRARGLRDAMSRSCRLVSVGGAPSGLGSGGGRTPRAGFAPARGGLCGLVGE